jgi:hypothetical protein
LLGTKFDWGESKSTEAACAVRLQGRLRKMAEWVVYQQEGLVLRKREPRLRPESEQNLAASCCRRPTAATAETAAGEKAGVLRCGATAEAIARGQRRDASAIPLRGGGGQLAARLVVHEEELVLRACQSRV